MIRVSSKCWGTCINGTTTRSSTHPPLRITFPLHLSSCKLRYEENLATVSCFSRISLDADKLFVEMPKSILIWFLVCVELCKMKSVSCLRFGWRFVISVAYRLASDGFWRLFYTTFLWVNQNSFSFLIYFPKKQNVKLIIIIYLPKKDCLECCYYA